MQAARKSRPAEEVCDDPLARSTVEEVVRWTTPVNYMKRFLLQDVELHGTKLRAGEELAMFYASANRDDEVFDAPFEFDITRDPNPHLGFGTGEHFCLGAHVARLSSRALRSRVHRVVEPAERCHIASSFVVGERCRSATVAP
jgi:cytochrome P450